MDLLEKKFEKYLTKHAKNTIKDSLLFAKNNNLKTGASGATAAHLIYAVSKQKGSIGYNILNSNNIKKGNLDTLFKKQIKPHTNAPVLASYKKALKKAANTAMKHNHYFIGTEHILQGALNKNELKKLPEKQLFAVQAHINDLMENYMPAENNLNNLLGESLDKFTEYDHELDELQSIKTKTGKKISVLETFCDNLTRKAREGALDPLVGRHYELERIIRILARRNKNNPLLIGDAGVGKTALVHGLASAIEKGDVPANLVNKEVFSLDLGALLAGTVYRGEFEERIRDLIHEASNENVVLFIDEVHTLVGAGAAQGSIDASNILKPALANGALRCIGATTYEEYKKSIEKDSALERRFQKISVKEPTTEKTLETLVQLKPLYEKHHGVKISNEILVLCVQMADLYMPSRSFPDKAIDLLDEACSHARASQKNEKGAAYFKKLQIQLEAATKDKEQALKKEHYKKALLAKNRSELLKQNIKELAKKQAGSAGIVNVPSEAVYKATSDIASVPLGRITKHELDLLDSLEKDINNFIFGQKEAVQKVSKAIRKNRAGIKDKKRPLGSFIFMGPSGSGKTELGRVLAEIFSFGKPGQNPNPPALIKLDMSEFSEPHSISRLIGAPPGYIGHEEAGHLTDRINKNPYSVIVFDEIEKAHPNIFNILLQILEDGVLTDSTGRQSSFKNALIILTTNIGGEYFGTKGSVGFSGAAFDLSPVMGRLKESIRPEIINRMDDIIIFEKLDEASLNNIAKLNVKNLTERIKDSVNLQITPAVISWIAKNAQSEEKGARAIRAVVENQIESAVADNILKGAKEIKLDVKNNKLTVRTKSS